MRQLQSEAGLHGALQASMRDCLRLRRDEHQGRAGPMSTHSVVDKLAHVGIQRLKPRTPIRVYPHPEPSFDRPSRRTLLAPRVPQGAFLIIADPSAR